MTTLSADVDVAVVGAGIAGCVAALEARRALVGKPNARVVLIAAGEGASVHAGAAWDALGGARSGTLAEDLSALATREPTHPWSRLGARAIDGLSNGYAHMADALCLPEELPSRDAWVATELGCLRPAFFAEREVLNFAPDTLHTVMVASLPALRDPDARFLARALDEDATRRGRRTRFVSVEVEFVRRKRDVLLQPREAAAILDTPAACKRAAMVLRRAMGGAPIDGVLLPPVLGYDNAQVRSVLEGELGLPVGEWVASSGAQGGRRHKRLMAALERHGIALAHKRVRKIEPRGEGFRLALDDGTAMETRALVLATGKHLGGGVRLDDEPSERAMGLSLSTDGVRPTRKLATLLAARTAVGVAWDQDSMRALDDAGQVHARVFVCGSLLGGTKLDDGTGLGVALATGALAGASAAACVDQTE